MFFLNSTQKSKKIVYVFLFFCVAGLFLPIQSAQAIDFNPLGWLGDLAGGVATGILSIILFMPVSAANAFLGLASTLLGWIISPSFISVSYTGLDNPVIKTGWTLTRDLANMGFVVILLAIGLGTALRVSAYQFQKTLPLLIGVILLINFTPVILGVLVDAANIAMNFFLEGVSGGETFMRLFNQQAAIYQNMWQNIGKGLNTTAIAQLIVLTVFGFVAGFIILIFAGIFFIRYVAIWILVILSPLAFFSYVLPDTRGYFKIWWNHFFQWCFIGVAAAFFLYLSEQMIRITTPGGGISFSTGTDSVSAGFLNTLLPYATVIVFLVFGLFSALSISAYGAKEIINTAQKGVKKLPNSRPAQWAKGKAAEAGLATLGATSKIATRLDQGAGKLGLVGRGLQIATKPTAWAMRSAERLATPALIEYAATQRKTPTPKAWGEMSNKDKEKYILSQGLSQDRVALAGKMASDGTFKNTSKDFQDKMLSDAQKQAGNIHLKKEIEDIINASPDKITKKMMTDLELTGLSGKAKSDKKKEIENKIKELIDKENLAENEAQSIVAGGGTVRFDIDLTTGRSVPVLDDAANARIADEAARILQMKKLAPKDIEKVSKESLSTNAFRLATRDMTQSHFQKIIDTHGKETIDGILNGSGGLNTIVDSRDDLEEFYLRNPGLVNFFAKNPAGQALGWSGLAFASNDQDFRRLENRMRPIRKYADPVKRDLVLEYSRNLESTRDITETINQLRTANPADPDIPRLEAERVTLEAELARRERDIAGNPDLADVARDLPNLRKASA